MNNAGQAITKDTGGSCFKVDIINDAFSLLRISGLTLDPTPNDLDLALSRLEGMASEWESRGISTGYNFQDKPDANDDFMVPRAHWYAFSSNLCVRVIADFNKQVPQSLLTTARGALSTLSGVSAKNRLQGVPYASRQPIGSGNTQRYYRWRRFYRQSVDAPNSPATVEIVAGSVNDYAEHFESYLDLQGNETITDFDITMDTALTLDSSSISGNDVVYRISTADTADDPLAQVTIVITTSTGRKTTRFTNFSITPLPEYNNA